MNAARTHISKSLMIKSNELEIILGSVGVTGGVVILLARVLGSMRVYPQWIQHFFSVAAAVAIVWGILVVLLVFERGHMDAHQYALIFSYKNVSGGMGIGILGCLLSCPEFWRISKAIRMAKKNKPNP
jgi:hypothetical protein